ncbi:MAG: hypothetical protein CXX69_05090 [Candidatus Thalassarchaeum betae]|uniref:PD-(D/E)XK endonuclease-like domain-containing protein n=1 Tax=Candidatus Thalassarchaeum betae TaxID=2599289 RepID=A0A2V3HQS6_9ARCH|nr:MAG: hypothetical protein CXX69_05090 [Candidatus Thalassoarchaea betae]HIC50680.1 hypothetical protein [Candidatus Poseidoniales archaeon]HIM13794.1 hypothetical protein [Candidatus Poseidoniales archaeon]HIM92902.1 hypothetical protein [Candidatus Poseidoniales archaeon]
MPVRRGDPESVGVNPYRRLSASQVILWKSCNRLWYYTYMERLKSPLPPQIIRGNAVEECICRVLRDSPVLVADDADDVMTSPLLDDGSPAYDNPLAWPAPTLGELPEDQWPTDRDSLEAWAMARAETHFEACWDAAVLDWESIPNRVGSAGEADPDEALKMTRAGLRLHLDQVQACMKAGGGPGLADWRKGGPRGDWPAPDGFPRTWNEVHPAARGSGDITWCEAWEVARPWFVDPDAGQWKHTTSHPEEWFQGEYDMVYDWTGRIRIVDLKASIGKGDRSGGYLEQLRLYGWLWWETHGRADEVESLEIWYLGPGTVKDVPRPSGEEMEALTEELEELYQKIHARDPSITECPADPAPLRYFDEGGVPSATPVDPDPRARCTHCELRGVCEGSEHELELPLERSIDRFGHRWPVTPLGEIVTRVSAVGEVSGLRGPNLSADGTVDLSFTLQEGYDRAKVQPSRYGSPTDVTRAITNGSRVRIDNTMASVWRGEIVLDLDAKSSVAIADDSDSAPIVDIETKVNAIGRVWSINAFPDGVGVTRWSVTLVDQTGSAGVVAFRQFIPIAAAGVSRGDEIAILNGEIGEFNGQPQVRIGPGGRLVVLRDASEVPGF